MARPELGGLPVQTLTAETRFQILKTAPRADRRDTMAREVRAGLLRFPRSIPPKYFYDEVGSRLFDAICDLPEYYVTRAEEALLLAHADAIAESTRCTSLVEIGSGMARKTSPLLRAMCMRHVSPLYVPFDIASEPIHESAAGLLAAHPTLRVRGVVGDFTRECASLTAGAPPSGGPRLFAFLGSTIGNLDEREAPAMLRSIARLMTANDRFLLGIDLVKDAEILHAAYNDSRGVTAAFNKNVLRVISRELDGDIDVDAFEHFAFYDAAAQRIEMHLVSRRAQEFVLRAADVRASVAAGEHIRTEISRKFTRSDTERMMALGGMKMEEWITNSDAPEQSFALCIGSSSLSPTFGELPKNQA